MHHVCHFPVILNTPTRTPGGLDSSDLSIWGSHSALTPGVEWVPPVTPELAPSIGDLAGVIPTGERMIEASMNQTHAPHGFLQCGYPQII